MNLKNDINKAYAEVYEIIQFLGEEYSKKLPNKLINFLRDNKDNDYIVKSYIDCDSYSSDEYGVDNIE